MLDLTVGGRKVMNVERYLWRWSKYWEFSRLSP